MRGRIGRGGAGLYLLSAVTALYKTLGCPKDCRMLPDDLVKVGVFVNEKPKEIKRIVEYCGFDMIQLHGDETPEFCREFPSAQVIKAVELKNEADFVYAKSYHVGAILVDSRHAGLYGGTGKKANWDLACRIKNKRPLILSGGSMKRI